MGNKKIIGSNFSMKNKIILCVTFLLFGCGGGGGAPSNDSNTENNNQTNNQTTQLVNVTCPNGQIVKGNNSNDHSNCPIEKNPPMVLSVEPAQTPSSSYDPVSIKFDKPIKYGSSKCSISPAIPNVDCKVDFSSPTQISAKNASDLIIYSSKYSNQYTVTFSELRDENNIKIADVKVSFQTYIPPTIISKNGNLLATKDHLLNRCEKATVISTAYWNQCVEGLAFSGTTDPLNDEYCELSFNRDGSIYFYLKDKVHKTVSRSIYLQNKNIDGQFTFSVSSNAAVSMTAWIHNHGSNFNGQEFSVLMNLFSNKDSNFSQFRFESIFDATDYKNYTPIKSIRKKCFINSVD
jgi:hypothetical protein